MSFDIFHFLTARKAGERVKPRVERKRNPGLPVQITPQSPQSGRQTLSLASRAPDHFPYLVPGFRCAPPWALLARPLCGLFSVPSSVVRRQSSVAGLRSLAFIIICAASSFAQDNKCVLKLADLPAAPELFGFHMGMTTEQAKTRVPQVIFGRVDAFGVSKTSINPDFDPRIDKASLGGVRTVSLDFLDGRLTSLWFGYDGTFKWLTVPDFVTGISQSLHLPDAWKLWKIRGQQLNCADFQMTVTMVAEGPSWHVIDETAEETIASRREAKEEQDSAAEEAEPEIVADKRDKVYYQEGCVPAHEIAAANRVAFKSKEEAEKAGYKLAKACQ